MRRVIIAFLFLTFAAASVAQAQPAPAAKMAVQITEEKARADKAEHDLAIREAADQLESAQTEQAYNRFEIWTGIMMGGFSVLVTLLVIMFGFRTEKAAAVAARQEVANAKAQIDALLAEAKKAAEAAVAAQAQAEATKAEVDEQLKQSRDATTTAKANAEESARHVEMTRQSAAIIDGVKSNASDSKHAAPKLTPAQEEIVKEAASGTTGTPEAEWSVEEFKTRIGKARYLDKDWTEALRLADLMARNHGDDDEAYTFARNAEGDALREIGRDREAILAYDAVISRLGKDPEAEVIQLAMWARHHKGVCLANSGDTAGAEVELRALLPLCHDVDGVEHLNTLATRHELARTILEQGRAAEAETELRALLIIYERTQGSEHSGVLTTKHDLARAILAQGRATEAEAEFRALLSHRERVEGAEHRNTLATRHELARTILEQGRAAAAEAELRALLPLCEQVDGVEHPETLVTRHVLARAILDQGRAAEAEAEFRSILLLHERTEGAEHRNALATRHEIARALLDQGRAAEAEAEFRTLLPLRERVNGVERSSTFVTRFWFAAAVQENGDAAGAKKLLDPIPHQPANSGWLERLSAELAFIRGKVADALGERVEADEWFEKAAAHYAAIYPADHHYRRKFNAFLAKRPGA